MSYPGDPNQPQAAPQAAPQPPQMPQYAASQYPAPQYATLRPPTNTMAVISMVSSIVGFFSFGVLAVLGVVLGHVSLAQIKRTGEGGRGFGITALVVGYVAIAGYALLLLLFLLLIPLAYGASTGSVS